MEIIDLKAENILCFGNVSLEFDKFGKITRIEGDNQDSPMSQSNGAGKSSVYELIFWTYYGQTKKGLTGNDVVNERATKGSPCYAASRFRQSGNTYTVRRFRNNAPNLRLSMETPADTFHAQDLTKGTDKETQELLESIIKMSALTFSKMTYFGQEDVRSFADMGDKDLKVIFEQALGVDFLRRDCDRVAQHDKALATQQAEKEADLKALDAEMSRLAEKIRYLQDADRTLKAQQASEIVSIESEINSLVADVAEAKSALQALSRPPEDTTQPLQDELVRLVGLRNDLKAKIKAMEARDYYPLCATIANLERAIQSAQRRIDHADSIIGKPCGECGKVYQPQDLADVKALQAQAIDRADREINEAVGKKAAVEVQLKKLAALEEALSQKIEGVQREVTKARAVHEQAQKQHTEIKSRLLRLESALAAKNHLLKTTKARPVGYGHDIAEAQKSLSEAVVHGDSIKASVEEMQGQREVSRLLKTLLGDAGLKNFVFGSITPFLNKTANEYLQALDNINVEISTVKQLKSGEFRDKFGIEVINHSGASMYKANSGGERRKIDFAISLAFNAVIRAMSEESTNILFLDEPFEALDEGSAEAAVGLTGQIAGSAKVFIVAHNQHVKDLTSEIMTIQKKNGFSTIKGAA